MSDNMFELQPKKSLYNEVSSIFHAKKLVSILATSVLFITASIGVEDEG